MLTATITEDASQLYQLYGIDLKPKWFPVFYTMSVTSGQTISDIATAIGHSQPSVSKIIAEMTRKGLVEQLEDSTDKRRNVVKLSPKGYELTEKIKDQYTDVHAAIEQISAQTKNDLWEAIEEWEFLLGQRSLLSRVIEQRKERERKNIRIVNFEPQYASAYKELNKEWISTYFKMEESDYQDLDNFEEHILNGGGKILVALYHDEAVGVCAMKKMKDSKYDYELAKMAVSPKAQGLNIGWLLGQASIEKVKEMGASALYLESNTLLKPAISLYQKLGFQKVVGLSSRYQRCNIQMELLLTP